jgi:hypothetical protein
MGNRTKSGQATELKEKGQGKRGKVRDPTSRVGLSIERWNGFLPDFAKLEVTVRHKRKGGLEN